MASEVKGWSRLELDLAERFWQVASGTWAAGQKGGQWKAIARECLRQMEWAREQGEQWETIPAPRQPEMPAVPQRQVIGKAPLTLAPKDWSPSDGPKQPAA